MTFKEKLDEFCTGTLDALATILDLEDYNVDETGYNSLRVFCMDFLVKFELQLDALAALETAFNIHNENRNRYRSFGIDFITVWQGHEPRHRFVYPATNTLAGNLLHSLSDSLFNIVRDASRQKQRIQGFVCGEEDKPFAMYLIYSWPEELNQVVYLQQTKLEPEKNFVPS